MDGTGRAAPSADAHAATSAPSAAESAPSPADAETARAGESRPRPPGDAVDAADAPRSARREATRQRILDAAREVFAERGVIGGTVEDICERAGFTRGAFYSNFGDKDDVIDALVEREHARLLEHVEVGFEEVDRAVAAVDGDLGAVIDGLVERLLRTIPVDRQLSLVQTELEIFAIRRPDHAGRFVAINAAFRERLARFLDQGMRRYGRELTVNPLQVTDAIVAIAESSFRRALLAGPGADPDAMATAILPGLLLAVSRPVDDGAG
jgi:AcrR family transcriptional regulator